MIRAVFNETTLLVIIDHDPNSGTTYSIFKMLIDTPQGVADKLLDQGIDIQMLIDLQYIEFPDSVIVKNISDHPDSTEENIITRKVHVCRISPKLEQGKMILSTYVKTYDQDENLHGDFPPFFKSFIITGSEFDSFMSAMGSSTLDSWITAKIEALDLAEAFPQPIV